MAQSQFFNQISGKLIPKKMSQIYSPKPLNLGALSKKYTLPLSHANLHEESPQM